VSVVALPTTALTPDELTAILRYRLAQYLAIGFVSARAVFEQRLEYEPAANVSPGDCHIVAARADTAELLCYLSIMAPPPTAPGVTLRERSRPLFPVEHAHGWGTYNRLRLLPDLPVARLREIGRFVKNQRLPALNEGAERAPVEVLVAVSHLLAGALRSHVDAIVGDLEETVVKRNLDFFHVPLVVIHGTVAYVAEDALKYPMYLNHSHVPFAFSVSDLAPAFARTAVIENALALPGKQALLALLKLRHDAGSARSSFEPAEGLPPLTDVTVADRAAAMPVRRQMLDVGERLRAMEVFRDLSVAEATVLGTFMTHHEPSAGDAIVRRGEVGDAMFFIETGQAEVRLRTRSGKPVAVATLGPGDYFGEIAVVSGGGHAADVVAVTTMRVMRLSIDDYTRYLALLVDVQQRIDHTAATRAVQFLRQGGRPTAEYPAEDLRSGNGTAGAPLVP
jgi:hypothetical protein